MPSSPGPRLRPITWGPTSGSARLPTAPGTGSLRRGTPFREAVEKEPETSVATGLTRDRWLLPLFQELGYGRLPRSTAIEIENKTYAISHTWHHSPIHLLGCRIDLDRRQRGVAGAATSSPHGLVQEFLNRASDHLWGFVTNGYRLRVLRDHHSLTRQAYVEFDLQAIMDGEQYSEFLLLWLICHQSRVEADKPEECWLETWVNTSRDEGVRALDKLRDGVEKAIESFGTGFLAHRANTRLRDALESGELDRQEYYRQILRLVYRMIFLFVAEERDALLDPNATEEARERYRCFYATRRLHDLADKRRGTLHGDLWRGLALVMQRLDDGYPALGLPALGSFLWGPTACPRLMEAECGNEYVLTAVRHLSHIQEGKTRYPVNWRNVGADELGSIYESLLERHPRLQPDAATFELETAAGHERKTTGSYYTPTSLVDCLLDSTLDPVLDEACGKPNPEAAVLNLRVCDPACGSGHFLVAAARRIARRLASVRSGDDEPSPRDVQEALRDVVGCCIYGVDLNTMAVELCKVSLWMEAIEPGKPLSFLDSHIQCGNALLGATPALMARGIPDDAFKQIEGDDKKVAGDLKKQNKKERKAIAAGQETMFALFDSATSKDAAAIAEKTRAIEDEADDDITALRTKEERWENLSRSPEFKDAWFRADSWCAAFVWPKQPGDRASAAITDERWRQIARDTSTAQPATRKIVRGLSRQHHFFHWHLAFPAVFGRASREPSDEDTTGWTGGFDAVIGNPPWEKVKLQEREFFAERAPAIATAKTAAARRKAIEALSETDPTLRDAFLASKREAEAVALLVSTTGRFPRAASGDTNTYPLFLELAETAIANSGRAGLIVKTGIIGDYSMRHFFRHLVESNRIVSAFDFSNRRGLFPGVVANERFTLLTLRGSATTAAPFVVSILNESTDSLRDPDRVWAMTLDDLALINPNTRTCPLFQSRRDADLVRAIYRNNAVLEDENDGAVNRWAAEYYTMLHMTNDSGLFEDKEALERTLGLPARRFWNGDSQSEYVAVLEGKLFNLFDHRYGDFDGIARQKRFGVKAEPNHANGEAKRDPSYEPLSRYWIPSSEARARYTEKLGFVPPGVLAFRDVCRTHTDLRTVRAAVCPPLAAGNKAPMLIFPGTAVGEHSMRTLLLTSVLASLPFDYVARQKFSGGSLNKFILIQLPVVDLEQLRSPLWKGLTEGWFIKRAMELAYTSHSLRGFAKACGFDCPPFAWDDQRRQVLQCELDAAMFHLFGVARDDVIYILGCFPILERRDRAEYGDYRTMLLVLDVFDRLQRAIDGEEPYQTHLDPPPADSLVAHTESTRPTRLREGT